jgi:hypothetical protein
MPDDLEAAGDVAEDLGDILADLAQGAPAAQAGAARLMHDLVPRQMRRQRPAAGLPALRRDRRLGLLWAGAGGRRGTGRFLRLQLLQPQLELLELAGHLLRRAAVLLAPQAGDLELELLDLQRLGHQARSGGRELFSLRGDEPVQRFDIGRQIEGHERIVPASEDRSTCNPVDESIGRACPAAVGRQVRIGMRQSMPSSSMPSCAAVNATTPSADDGQTKWPFSSRLANRHSPWPSHHSTLISPPRRPGTADETACASPLLDLLPSTEPGRSWDQLRPSRPPMPETGAAR